LFFSGIAGSGVSAIACFMKEKGHDVSGSDRLFDMNSAHHLKGWFQSTGIDIFPQDGSGISGLTDLVVFSTSLEGGHPELLKARGLNIPTKTRPEYLIELSSGYRTIAVTGTSGKSTTAGLLAFLMYRLGIKPNFIGGGRVKQFVSSKSLGNHLVGDSDYLVIEACESDGMIINYKPEYTIILNLDLDHHPIDETGEMFNRLIRNTKAGVIINADDKNLAGIKHSRMVGFSVYAPSDYRVEKVIHRPFNTEFLLHSVRFELPLPGEHNLYNAISCIAFLSEMGVPLGEIAEVLSDFKGIYRRFDVYLNSEDGLVIDDYAHNPHKILYLMKTVSRIKKDICYVFQPHGFGPTRFMRNEYIKVFVDNLRNSDHLIILPIYYTGGTVVRDISSHDLADEIMAHGRSVEVIDDRRLILKRCHEYDTFVIFGARDDTLSDIARDIASVLSG